MTHFISITKVGDQKTVMVGNIHIKEYLEKREYLTSGATHYDLVHESPFWVVKIEKDFGLELISLNRNTTFPEHFSDKVTTVDMVFNNPKAR